MTPKQFEFFIEIIIFIILVVVLNLLWRLADDLINKAVNAPHPILTTVLIFFTPFLLIGGIILTGETMPMNLPKSAFKGSVVQDSGLITQPIKQNNNRR